MTKNMEFSNDPFKSSQVKAEEQKNRQEVLITREELVTEFEKLKEPYSKIEKPVQRLPRKDFNHVWYDVLTREIQQVTDALEKMNNMTSQNEMKRVKKLIEGIKTRLTVNGYIEESRS